MQLLIAGLIGLILHTSVGSEELLEGRVRLSSGEPVVGATVRLTDRGRLVNTTVTDARGWFALPLRRTALPTTFTLGQNYPNPFNPSTIIPYQLSAAGHVRLEMFNLLGQHLATLVDSYMLTGHYEARWDGTDAAGRAVGAGVYIYRMTVGVESRTGRMVLIDGQAGLSAGAAASVLSGASGIGGPNGERGQVYGLIVSDSGLVPYVDPAFRIEEGMAPVELVMSSGLHSAGKATDDDCAFCDLLNAFNDQEESSSDSSDNADAVSDSTDSLEDSTDSSPSYPGGGRIYWHESSWKEDSWGDREEVIYRANLDGSNIESLYSTLGQSISDFTLDIDGGWMYWLQGHPASVWRARLDGSGEEEIVSTPMGISSFDLDVDSNRIYWWDWPNYSIWRANLDGSESQEIVSNSVSSPYVDLAASQIYWAVEFSGTYTFCRENFDGSDEKCVPSDVPVGSSFILIGAVNGSIAYWRYERCGGGRCRGIAAFTDFDTGEVKPLEGLPQDPNSLWTFKNHIYWRYFGGIWRTNVDRSNPEEIIRYDSIDIINVREFGLDLSKNRACWVGQENRANGGHIVQCANLDRSGLDESSVENVFDISFTSHFAGRLVFDMAGNRTFWLVKSEPRLSGFNIESEYSIWRAGLDDLEPQRIVSEVRNNVELWTQILALEISPQD